MSNPGRALCYFTTLQCTISCYIMYCAHCLGAARERGGVPIRLSGSRFSRVVAVVSRADVYNNIIIYIYIYVLVYLRFNINTTFSAGLIMKHTKHPPTALAGRLLFSLKKKMNKKRKSCLHDQAPEREILCGR